MPTNQKIILENDIILSKSDKYPTVDVGGIKRDYNVANKTLTEVMNQLLFPYAKCTVGAISASNIKHYTTSNSQVSIPTSNNGASISTISIDSGKISCLLTPRSVPINELEVSLLISTKSNPSENDGYSKKINAIIDNTNHVTNSEDILIKFEDNYLNNNLRNSFNKDILKSAKFNVNGTVINSSNASRYASIYIVVIVNDNISDVKVNKQLYMNDGIIWGAVLDTALSSDQAFTDWDTSFTHSPQKSWISSLYYSSGNRDTPLGFYMNSNDPYSLFIGIPSTYSYKDITNINSIEIFPGTPLAETWSKVSFTDSSVTGLPAGMKNISKPIDGDSTHNIGRPYYIFKNGGGLTGKTSVTKTFNFDTSV